MFIKNLTNLYNLFLSLGAFYVGTLMLLRRGAFDEFPQEWIGKIPFNNWDSLAVFGILVFGVGNAAVALYGFIKKHNNIFVITMIMGMLFFFCTMASYITLGEWYLPTGLFLVLSLLQLLIGIFFRLLHLNLNRSTS